MEASLRASQPLLPIQAFQFNYKALNLTMITESILGMVYEDTPMQKTHPAEYKSALLLHQLTTATYE